VVYEAVLDRGEEFHPLPRRPPGVRKHADKACFLNALKVVCDHHDWRYAEGFALVDGGMWIHHAWVVDQDAHAIEVTWRTPGLRYVGVTFGVREACNLALDSKGGRGFGSLLDPMA
jgi:hypothetical protein